MTAELSIYETFTEAGVQHYTGADSFALNGAFVGYGVDYVQLGEATADMVVELLCDGKTPADLPFQTFDNGIATINTETCEALGLDLDTVKKALCTLLHRSRGSDHGRELQLIFISRTSTNIYLRSTPCWRVSFRSTSSRPRSSWAASTPSLRWLCF